MHSDVPKMEEKGIVDKLECEVGIPLIESYEELAQQSFVTVYYICTRQSSYICATYFKAKAEYYSKLDQFPA